MSSNNSTLEAALRHQQAGRLDEAERICRQILQTEPNNPDALALLGVLAQQASNSTVAVDFLNRAIALGSRDEAVYNSLGIALCELGRFAEARETYMQGLVLQPQSADLANNLGHALGGLGQVADAEQAFRRAVALKIDFSEAYNNLGLTLTALGRFEEAVAVYRQALAINPRYLSACIGLGNTLRMLGRLAEAERSYREALALKPDSAEIHSDFGAILGDLGRLVEGELHYRKAVQVRPDSAALYSNRLLVLNHLHGLSPEAIFREHREFGYRYERGIKIQTHRNQREPLRRLRLGYCSGDLRQHAVASFIEPVLSMHDHNKFEIFCYYNNPRSDTVTLRLKGLADHWREVSTFNDDAFCDLVRQDEIDILVDLSGHSARNRLTAFARKPAPVQVTWLGYINTTGLNAMDYRITDIHVSPDGPLDALNTERLFRLPGSQWCYQPPREFEVGPPPSASSGVITFGAFTRPLKVNEGVIDLWRRLLERVPNSRLCVLLAVQTPVPSEYVKRFLDLGFPKDRFATLGGQALDNYLKLHGDVDVMLDTFPVVGGTTTCDSLWMGVPVVSLAGDAAWSRSGVSLLTAVGLGELVAYTTEQYIDIAAALATDPQRLASLRAGLRERMRNSSLMNAERFTRNLEAAFRAMWCSWCGRGNGLPEPAAGRKAD